MVYKRIANIYQWYIRAKKSHTEGMPEFLSSPSHLPPKKIGLTAFSAISPINQIIKISYQPNQTVFNRGFINRIKPCLTVALSTESNRV